MAAEDDDEALWAKIVEGAEPLKRKPAARNKTDKPRPAAKLEEVDAARAPGGAARNREPAAIRERVDRA